ncbi:MAG: transglutaminase-like domain-containing protein [Paludisphaera borealis]|uniref:SirB1 family protein n=1 Tax=Paludisphaera borealis TaxID=1387353 RepID=UPI00283F348D|nr:transglutaminase-like domain-containing protein [Paludisphaera borealis]MDR3621518.1 transglutaminase-like domain-containing protein [Paludisphaera borealis]
MRNEPRPSLDRVALEIARDAYPDLRIDAYVEHIDRLAQRIRERCRPDAPTLKTLRQINWVLFIEEGYTGNQENYFDPRNSYLNEVVDRKMGIPISLSVLYWSLADRLGIGLSAANLPAHFMLRLDAADRPVFIDPFHAGEILDLDACQRRLSQLTGGEVTLSEAQIAPCSFRVVVARMLRNLKAVYLGEEDYPSAHQIQRRLAAMAGDDPIEQRDLGMICLQLDLPSEAIDPLAAYLRSRPEASDSPTVRDLLTTAKGLVARWN